MSAAVEHIHKSGSLIPVQHVNALELFTQTDQLDKLLHGIRKELTSEVADVSTDKGRKAIAHRARLASSTKEFLDNAGKEKVAELKKLPGEIDAGRRRMRDFLENLRDEIRQPLTEWEAEQFRIEEEKRLAAEAEAARIAAEAAAEAARIEAEREAALRERERVLAEREAAIAKAEAERQEQERLKEQEADRKAREEQIRREAEAKAKRDAEAALQAAEEARLQAEQAAREAEERRQREAIEAEERAEREQIEATLRAARQAELAVEQERLRAAREAEAREQRRLAEEARKRQEEAARAADKANRDRVNEEIIEALAAEGISHVDGERIVVLIATGAVPHVSIRY